MRSHTLIALLAFATYAPAQVLTASKILSGSGADVPSAIALDAQGNVVIAGTTTSPDFPVVNGLPSAAPLAALRVTTDGQHFSPSSLDFPAVTAFAASSDGRTLLAAYRGSLDRSADAGATWSAAASISDDIIALAIDPTNAANVYAVSDSSVFYRSADGGATWKSSPGPSGFYTNPSRIVIDPQNPSSIYAYFTNQYYFSADSGSTWQEAAPGNVQAIAFAPSQPQTVYAFVSPPMLERSTDGGVTWQPTGAFYTFNPGTLAVDPQDPNGVWFIDNAGIEHSADGGMTAQNVFSKLGTTWTAIVVNPQNSSQIFAADAFNVYASLDAGATWNAVAQGQLSNVIATPLAIYLAESIPTTLFVAKLDPTLTQVIFSTLIGPAGNSGIGLALDPAGNALVTGMTLLAGFPTTPNALQPAMTNSYAGFAAKLRADGAALLYSTFLNNFTPGGAAFDSNGNAVIVGTAQPGVAASANAYQSGPLGACSRTGGFLGLEPLSQSGSAYALKLSADGSSIQYATYLTGSCGDSANAVQLDAAGNVYVTGYTFSLDFPITPGAITATFPGGKTSGFLAELSPDASKLLYSTFFGGGENNSGNALALDGNGNIFVAGYTQSAASPGALSVSDSNACPPVLALGPPLDYSYEYEDAFVMKTTLSAASPAFFAKVGGMCQDSAQSVSLDQAGNIWLAGITGSSDFPLEAPIGALGYAPGGFISEIDPTGSELLFSTFAGAVANTGPAVAASGSGAYAAVPVTQPPKIGGQSALVAFIDGSQSPPIQLNSIAQLNAPGVVAGTPYLPPSIAPGQLVLLNGAGLGPMPAAQAKVAPGGTFPTNLAGVEVAMNGARAPLVSAGANQIECQAPFELAGATVVNIVVQYDNQTSNTFATSVVPQQVSVLAVVNADGTPNSPTNLAPEGSTVTLYLTGLGVTIPPSIDGALNTAAVAPAVLPSFSVNGNPVQLAFLGAAPGESSAVFQMNISVSTAVSGSLGIQSNGALNTIGPYVSAILYVQ